MYVENASESRYTNAQASVRIDHSYQNSQLDPSDMNKSNNSLPPSHLDYGDESLICGTTSPRELLESLDSNPEQAN